MRLVRITPRFTEGAPLTQEVPALIQFNINRSQTLAIGIRKRSLSIEPMFLRYQGLNTIQDRLIFLIVHNDLLGSLVCRQIHLAGRIMPSR